MIMPAKVYAVVNRKGGVGKTTTAVTLAHGLAKKIEAEKGTVLLVDLDPQGNCATSLGIKSNGADISHLLTGRLSIEQCVMSANRAKDGGPSRPNLFVIPSSDRLLEAKAELLMAAVNSQIGYGQQVPIDQILNARLGKAAAVFTYIIIDCPPSLDILGKAVYNFAKGAIVPVKVDYLGAAGTVQHTDNIVEAQEAGIDIKITAIVPTFVRPRELLARKILESLVRRYGRRVSAPIPQSVCVEQAPAVNTGALTLYEYAPDSEATAAYQKLVEMVHNER
jgi:chromosome partitioning protein